MSIDPMDFMQSGNPANFNRYAYSFNDPINLIDPNGQYPISPNDPRAQFVQGAWEGATGSYTAWQLSRGIERGDPRSLFIAHGMSVGMQMARNNPSEAAELAINSLGNNKSRLAGRVAGGAGTSIVGGKGVKAAYGKLGGGKFAQSAAGLSIGATNFSSGQIASATSALGGLYDNISEAGFDPGNVSVGAVGDAAVISAAGGDISFNAKTGAITAKLPAETGSRLRKTVTLDELEK